MRLSHEPQQARSQRNRGRDRRELTNFRPVNVCDQSGCDSGIKQLRAISLEIVTQPLLAAGDGKKFPIKCLIPIPVQPQLSEGTIVSNALAEALRFRDRAVEIQEETAEFAVHAGRLIIE
jgi:hypothetical protein